MIMRYEDALDIVLKNVVEPRVIRLPLMQCRDLIAAEDIVAREPYPICDYAAVNGYAVRAADTKGATRDFPVEARMVSRLDAGQIYRHALKAGEAVRVLAGSVLPPEASAVVMIEDAERVGEKLKIFRAVEKSENVRVKGEDMNAEEIILKRGRRIRPQEIAMLAAIGCRELRVFAKPEVAVLLTGAEQVPLAKHKKHKGEVWNCITPLLSSLIEENGGLPVDLGTVKERKWALKFKMKEGLRYPIFIIAGGAFAREYDLVKELLNQLGVKELFWRVNIRPGRPVFFGRGKHGLVFGVSDTVGSAYINFEEFIRPVILHALGRERLRRREMSAIAGADFRNPSKRTFFVRSFLRRNGRNVTVFPSGNQQSHMVKTLSRSNVLVTLEANQDFVRRGSRLRVRVLD